MRLKQVVKAKPNLSTAVLAAVLCGCATSSSSKSAASEVLLPEPTPTRSVASSSPAVREGETLLAKGDAKGAKAKFEEAIREDPRDVRALLDLGLALEALEDFDGAEAAYRRAVAVDPGFAEALNNLGVLLREGGELEDAVAALRHAVEADPDLGSARANLAMAYEDAGDVRQAAESYRLAVRLLPDDPMVRANHGLFLLKLGKKAEAIAEFRAGVPHAARDRAALLAMGNGLRRSGEAGEAASVIQQAISAGDGKATPALLAELSLAQHAAGDVRGAKASLQSALRADPKYATAHYLLISMLLSEGDLSSANKHYKRLQALDESGELARRAKANIEAVKAGHHKRE